MQHSLSFEWAIVQLRCMVINDKNSHRTHQSRLLVGLCMSPFLEQGLYGCICCCAWVVHRSRLSIQETGSDVRGNLHLQGDRTGLIKTCGCMSVRCSL